MTIDTCFGIRHTTLQTKAQQQQQQQQQIPTRSLFASPTPKATRNEGMEDTHSDDDDPQRIFWDGPLFSRLTKSGKDYLLKRGWRQQKKKLRLSMTSMKFPFHMSIEPILAQSLQMRLWIQNYLTIRFDHHYQRRRHHSRGC